MNYINFFDALLITTVLSFLAALIYALSFYKSSK